MSDGQYSNTRELTNRCGVDAAKLHQGREWRFFLIGICFAAFRRNVAASRVILSWTLDDRRGGVGRWCIAFIE